MTTATKVPSTFEEAEVSLAESLPGYESRSQQQHLARSVEQALAEGSGSLLAEAGCGTGKSLGYLIPSILSGKRVIVSTATKALQDQVANKDLPFLDEHLGKPFTYALLKGRANYACAAKLTDPEVQVAVPAVGGVLQVIQDQAASSDFMAERDDFAMLSDADWRKVTTSSEECPGKSKCDFGAVCFAEKAKAKAKASDIVVVNHALFLTDLKIKMEGAPQTMLDAYDAVVFDEAHEIEEYAGSVFGSSFTEVGLRNAASEVRNFAVNYLTGETEEQVVEKAEAMLTELVGLWMVLKTGVIREADLLEVAEPFVGFTNSLGDLSRALRDPKLLEMTPPEAFEDARKKRQRLVNKIGSMFNNFKVILTGEFTDHVRWVEEDRTPKGEVRKVLKVAPVSVAPILRAGLFENTDEPVTAVLASATMSVKGSFDYLAGRLGIDTFTSVDVGTPFDYASQAGIYVPRDLPEPTPANRAAWQSMAISRMGELVKASNGRALLLFTSSKAMKEAYDLLAPRLPYTCLMQGQMPNKALAEAFMADTHSVLFGTRSFMTGVDFQGEACSLVVVDKLAFPVPTEPLTEARCNLIKANGGSDFTEYTLPVMTLVMKQAAGRLIRHRSDRGVLAILDPRLFTKSYGKGIINSLPPMRRIESVEGVKEFFNGL